jgi:transcriptional regulator with XRE-family HTH domain
MTWHIRLTQAREAAGISKAKLVDVSLQAVLQWENGQSTSLSADDLLAICDALNIEPRWLARGAGPTPPQIALKLVEAAPSSLGERIKVARLASGLSQEALGALVGKTKGAVSQWEQGTTTPGGEGIVPLARALGVSLDWLLGSDVTPLIDLRKILLKKSGMQVVSQLTDALASGRISESRLRVLAALVDEFATPL